MRTRMIMIASVLAGSAAPVAAEDELAPESRPGAVYVPLANNPHDDHAICHTVKWSSWPYYANCKQIRDDEAAQYKADANAGTQSPVFDEAGLRSYGRRDVYTGAPTGTTSESTYSGAASVVRNRPLWPWYAPGTSAYPSFEQNGSTINSCDEYGYKRYYQINRHLDAVGQLTAAKRYSEAVNVILDGAPAIGSAKAFAPATGYFFVNYDGQAVTQFTPHFNGYLVQKLTPPDNRNPFWQVPTLLIKSLPATGADWEKDIDWALAVSNSKSSPSNAATWEYAKQMRSDPAITSLSIAERDEIAYRVQRMRRALFRAAKQFEKCTNDRFRKITASTAISPQNLTFAEYVSRIEPGAGYTDPIEWHELALQAQLLDDATRASTLSNVLAASSTTKDIYYYYANTQTGKTLRSLATVDRASLESAVSYTTTSYKSGDLTAGCNIGYAEVAALLVEEYRRGATGCMATNSKRCEFSPILFTRDVMDQLALRIPDIDLAKDQCLTYLGANFNSWASFVPTVERKDLATFEAYFKRRKAYLDEVLRDTPRRSELPNSIGDRRGGGSDWGDPARFGAGYSYDAEWGVNVTEYRDSDGAPCRLGGQVKGSMNAYVSAFGVKRDLVDAGLKARTAQPNATETAPEFDAHVNILGIDVYQTDDQPLPTSYSKANNDSYDVPLVRTTILLGFVPVTIEAGFGFDYGYRLEAKFEQAACSGAQPPQLRLSGVASPHAGADAYVSAYLDLFVVGAGVKGELTLVEAHLPFDASVEVKSDSSNDGSYAVRAKSSLKLDLVELSGNIAFVVKVVGITVWEKVLFQWGGIRQSLSLWNHDVEFPFAGFNLL